MLLNIKASDKQTHLQGNYVLTIALNGEELKEILDALSCIEGKLARRMLNQLQNAAYDVGFGENDF